MKLDSYWEQHASVSSEESANHQKSEIESNILIQFRTSGLLPACIFSLIEGETCSSGKLREGISSSQRHDQFAIEGGSSHPKHHVLSWFLNILVQRMRLPFGCLSSSIPTPKRRRSFLVFFPIFTFPPHPFSKARLPRPWRPSWPPFILLSSIIHLSEHFTIS